MKLQRRWTTRVVRHAPQAFRQLFGFLLATSTWSPCADFVPQNLGGSRRATLIALPAIATAEPWPNPPVTELCRLHEIFGGDSSELENRPMAQDAASGGTISALSVQLPALRVLWNSLAAAQHILDVGFGSGVMVAMLLTGAPLQAKCYGVDLEDKVAVATRNLLGAGPRVKRFSTSLLPIARDRFELFGGDVFHYLQDPRARPSLPPTFDVAYVGCCLDMQTMQLELLLKALGKNGAAVFNYGDLSEQVMYYVSADGACQQLMNVRFMMCVSPTTPPDSKTRPRPSNRQALCEYIKEQLQGPGLRLGCAVEQCFE